MSLSWPMGDGNQSSSSSLLRRPFAREPNPEVRRMGGRPTKDDCRAGEGRSVCSGYSSSGVAMPAGIGKAMVSGGDAMALE
jgi:hypothetical protein